MTWAYGDVIVHREVAWGRPWLATAERVVEDRDDLLVTFMPTGMPFGFAPGPWPTENGLHPWQPKERWEGHGVLVLQRPGDAYAVWHFWLGDERVFASWYINLQEPFRRTEIGYDTQDHELDVLVLPDGQWFFKDDELMEERIRQGRYSVEEVVAIRAQGAAIGEMLDSGTTWWDPGYASWEPDPAWGLPVLPSGWSRFPTRHNDGYHGPVVSTATESSTRERLIAAAIEVFAEQGYEGARLQDIARAAGLTTGAVYANYRGKAELLFDAIGARAGAELDGLLQGSADVGTRALLERLGDRLPQPRDTNPSLLVDAIAAARRDDDLAALLRARFEKREAMLTDVVVRAQRDGSVDDSISTEAFTRFCTMLATGAVVLRGLGIEQPDPDDWHALIARLLDALAPDDLATAEEIHE